MAKRRLRCVLIRTFDIRTASTAVSICLYILLTDIASHRRSEGCGFDSRLGLGNILSSKQFTFKLTKVQVISYIYKF